MVRAVRAPLPDAPTISTTVILLDGGEVGTDRRGRGRAVRGLERRGRMPVLLDLDEPELCGGEDQDRRGDAGIEAVACRCPAISTTPICWAAAKWDWIAGRGRLAGRRPAISGRGESRFYPHRCDFSWAFVARPKSPVII